MAEVGSQQTTAAADRAEDGALLSSVVIAQAPFGFALIDGDMRYVAVNEALAGLHGRAVADHPGRSFDEVIPRVAEQAREVFAQVVRERVAVRGAVLGGPRTGGAEDGLVWEDVWYPIFDADGVVTQVAVAVLEVTHLRRSQDRMSIVARINDALAQAETEADVVASLDVISDVDPGMSLQLWLAGDDRLGAESGLPVVEVLSSGRARYFESRGRLVDEFPAIAPLAASSAVRSLAYVPLQRSDGVFGVLRWTWLEERSFSLEDRRFFETIGASFATAYQRAQQREREEGAGRRAEAVLEALAPLATTASTAEVVRVVTSLGPDPLGANGISIAMIDSSDAGRRQILGSVGYPADFMEEIRVTSIDFPTPPNRVMVTSQPLYIRSPEELYREFPEVAGNLVGSAVSWAALPLRSGGRTIGALSLSYADRQRFGGRQRVELAGYAAQIADALARALRQEEDHQVAVHLQRSLLPARLPRLIGAALTARYLPGSDLEIGGDWYDAVDLDGGRLFLVVGDVMGHGVAAAVAMGQLRAAARALSPGHDPAQLLSELDRFVGDVEDASLATAAAVVLDVASGTVEYSLAGHPPPLVRALDGRVTRLDDALGAPLGFSQDPRRSATATMTPGSMMVLYTDGLFERRGEDLGAGLERLERAVAELDPSDTEAAADTLVVHCLEGFRQRDDIALVCLTRSAGSDGAAVLIS